MRHKAFLYAVAALFVSAPLAAEPSDQALIDSFFGSMGGDADNLTKVDYTARCVVEKNTLAADAFVRNFSDAEALAKNQAQLIDDKCIKTYFFKDSTTSFDPDIYREILAQALLELAQNDKSLIVEFGSVAPVDMPRLPAVPVADIHPFYRPLFVLDHHVAKLSKFADCAVRSRSNAVLALAATKRGSKEEAAALEDIESAPAECASHRPAVSFPAFARRGELILQLYLLSRLSGAPAPTPMLVGKR